SLPVANQECPTPTAVISRIREHNRNPHTKGGAALPSLLLQGQGICAAILMSVDIARLAAHLAPDQQRAIAKEYRRRAQHDTTAFLLCFFAGLFGAHRFYLRQFGSGLLHLLLPVAAIVVVVVGMAAGASTAAVAIVAIALLLIGLVWAIIDLFGIDDE